MLHPKLLALLVTQLIPSICGVGWTNDNGALVDPQGRERFMHGVNVIYKSAPYAPITTQPDDGKLYDLSFTATDAKFLRSLGLNVIRLGVMWGGTAEISPFLHTTAEFAYTSVALACLLYRRGASARSIQRDLHQRDDQDHPCLCRTRHLCSG